MKYYSTRDLNPNSHSAKTFTEVVLSGFADDGGLYVPATLPHLPLDEILNWKNLPYWQIAAKICGLFASSEFDEATISRICKKAAESFDNSCTLLLTPLESTNTQILELYHGATGAFKDLSMSALGGFYDEIAAKSENESEKKHTKPKHVVALVCTTGDTGPAALAGFAHCTNATIINMYGRGWCSGLQQQQMLKSGAANGCVWEFDGTPDNMDRAIQKVFQDKNFLSAHPQMLLVSVNSCNWFRVMYQIVHYFWVFLQFVDDKQQQHAPPTVRCYVPTSSAGAGHITGGVMAKLMGLPIELVAAVNDNDVMYRLLNNTNEDQKSAVPVASQATTTLATAMDGVFPYNFERLLYFASNGNAQLCRKVMHDAFVNEQVSLSNDVKQAFSNILRVERVKNDDIGKTMRLVQQKFGKFICPHTACAVCVSLDEEKEEPTNEIQRICFATARPEKFTEAVERVGLKPDVSFQTYFDTWKVKSTRAQIVNNDEIKSKVACAGEAHGSVNVLAKQLETLLDKICLQEAASLSANDVPR